MNNHREGKFKKSKKKNKGRIHPQHGEYDYENEDCLYESYELDKMVDEADDGDGHKKNRLWDHAQLITLFP